MDAASSVWQSVTGQFQSVANRDYAALRSHSRSLSNPPNAPSNALPSEHYSPSGGSPFSLNRLRQLPYLRLIALLLGTLLSLSLLWTLTAPSQLSWAPVEAIDSPASLANADGNRTLISYVYHETPDAKANAEFFLRHAMHDSSDFVFIVNGKTDTVKWPVERSNVRLVRRNNTCFDLGAHGAYRLVHFPRMDGRPLGCVCGRCGSLTCHARVSRRGGAERERLGACQEIRQVHHRQSAVRLEMSLRTVLTLLRWISPDERLRPWPVPPPLVSRPLKLVPPPSSSHAC